jgi:hypothetical protein
LLQFENVDSSLHSLLNLDIRDIFKSLPNLERDPSNALEMFVSAYGEMDLLPLIATEFGPKINNDPAA